MIDFGLDKIGLIGAVALIVIGPEKLPRVARTVGALLGKARRYVADVKAEVNRSIELEELQKMKTQFSEAARDVEQSVRTEMQSAGGQLHETFNGISADPSASVSSDVGWQPPPPSYRHPRKNWRLKRGATPQWYKQRQGTRTKALSGAARVARYRPPAMKAGG
jgi:sec-independent protein translocase protein TatB